MNSSADRFAGASAPTELPMNKEGLFIERKGFAPIIAARSGEE
jgi:hypothetical protein